MALLADCPRGVAAALLAARRGEAVVERQALVTHQPSHPGPEASTVTNIVVLKLLLHFKMV